MTSESGKSLGNYYHILVPNRIFVGGINFRTTDAELFNFFGKYGRVLDAKVIVYASGVSKGYGFVTFKSRSEARRLIRSRGKSYILSGRVLNIAPAFRKYHIENEPEWDDSQTEDDYYSDY